MAHHRDCPKILHKALQRVVERICLLAFDAFLVTRAWSGSRTRVMPLGTYARFLGRVEQECQLSWRESHLCVALCEGPQ